jgi:hypothetical protein
MIQTICSELPQWAVYSAFSVYVLVDYLLGKTSFNGILESVIETPLKAIWAKFFPPAPPPKA